MAQNRKQTSLTPAEESDPRSKRPLAVAVARRVRRDGPLILLDIFIAWSAYLVALVLRFDGDVSSDYWSNFARFSPVAVLLHLAANYAFGLYGRMWRYASLHEARSLVLAGSSAGILIISGSFLGGNIRLIPVSVAVLGATLSLLGFGLVRFQSRLFGLRRRVAAAERNRMLIVGAGEAGAKVLRDLQHDPMSQWQPVAVVDDDPKKAGKKLHGIEVIGDRTTIPNALTDLSIDQVLMAIPSATSDVIRNVADICESAGVTLRVLPSVHEIVGGQVTLRDIRDLKIEDLLGRQQVDTDLAAVRSLIAGRRVLITGAGGSIGSEIARQVSEFAPAEMLLLDHDETHLHNIATDLPEAMTILLDIRERDRLFRVFQESGPELVFHAAAHKHVPMLEGHPHEAFLTNVVGTLNVSEAAVAAGARRFVLISTDKAVRPTSVMGASKRIAEQIVSSMPEECSACTVRFGNVLGSRGSVIPTFLRQIAHGGPITVTHPDMTRYFMSLHEAVQLVLQAAALAGPREVLTLDMGEPVNILDLANKIVRLSGRIPGKDVEISIVGPRPGEKLDEDVVDPHEEPIASTHPAIVVSRSAIPDRSALLMAINDLLEFGKDGLGHEVAERMKTIANGVRTGR